MLKYSLKQLAVFDAVAEFESVSAAGRHLCMTQSAVSMALNQLERQLDRPLFNRQGNRLTLSHWGRWLRPKARKLLQDAKQIEVGLHDEQLISGPIRLSASQTAAEHLVPELISKLDSDFPHLNVELTVDNTEHVIEDVLNHHVDLGIIESRNDDSRLNQEIWLEDHLVVVASKHHPFALQDQVSLAQLEQAQWVLREHGAGTRGIFDGAVHGLMDNINVWKTYQHVPVLKTMVKRGQYLSAIPLLDVEIEVANQELVILPTPELDLHRNISFIWRYDAGENPLRDCLLAEGRRMARRRRRQATC